MRSDDVRNSTGERSLAQEIAFLVGEEVVFVAAAARVHEGLAVAAGGAVVPTARGLPTVGRARRHGAQARRVCAAAAHIYEYTTNRTNREWKISKGMIPTGVTFYGETE